MIPPTAFLGACACFWLAATLAQLAPGLVGSLGDLPLIAPASVCFGLGAGLLSPGGHKPAEELLSTMLRLVSLFTLYAALGLFFTVMSPGLPRNVLDFLLLPSLFVLNALALVPAGRALAPALDGVEPRAARRALVLAAAGNGALLALLHVVDTPLLRLAPALVFLLWWGLSLKLPRRGLILTSGLALACLLLCGAAGWLLTWSNHVLLPTPISSPPARLLLPDQARGQDRDRPDVWTGVVIDNSFFDFAVDLDPIRLEMAAARAPRETAVLAGMAEFYRLPFRLRPPGRALVINSGLGNTLAAGEREGWQALEAQESDPALLKLGLNHPERPYQAPGLVIQRGAALSLLRRQPGPYDLIVLAPALADRLSTRVSGETRAAPLYTTESMKAMAGCLSSDGIVAIMVSTPQRYVVRRLYQMLVGQFGPATAWSWSNTTWKENWTLIAAGPGVRRYRPRPGPGLVDRTAELSEGRVLPPVSRDWPYPFLADPGLPLVLCSAVALLLVAAVWLLGSGGALRNLEPSSVFGGAFLAFMLMRSWSLPVPPAVAWTGVGLLFLAAALFSRKSSLARRSGSILAGFGLAAPTCLGLLWVGSLWPTVAGGVSALLFIVAAMRRNRGT